MNPKEELRQYKNKVKDVDRTLKEYDKFMTRATKMTAVMSQMAARTNLPSDKVGDNAAKMADLSQQYADKWFEAERTRERLVAEINKVGGVLADVLYDLYIEGLTMEQTAQDVHYSYDSTVHLHGIALKSFENRDNLSIKKQEKTY